MTLFVAGVHAVGKSYLLGPVCASLGVRHATASQLIREQRGLENWTTSRQVGDIDENQRALVVAVQRLEQSGERVVLDGHFVLRRAVGTHEEIGLETFSQLKIQGVILLEAPSETIYERLVRRGDTTWEKVEIDAFAQKELEHARFVCRELGIPMVRVHSPSELEMQERVSKLLS